MSACGHVLCELIGGDECGLHATRSRGCTPMRGERTTAPEILDEVRSILDVLDRGERDDATRAAAVRLAEIIRREALAERYLLAQLRIEEPELAPRLERYQRRHAKPA